MKKDRKISFISKIEINAYDSDLKFFNVFSCSLLWYRLLNPGMFDDLQIFMRTHIKNVVPWCSRY